MWNLQQPSLKRAGFMVLVIVSISENDEKIPAWLRVNNE